MELEEIIKIALYGKESRIAERAVGLSIKKSLLKNFHSSDLLPIIKEALKNMPELLVAFDIDKSIKTVLKGK